MNLINQVKTAVGIDPAYDIVSNTMGETERAKSIFLAAVKQTMTYGDMTYGDITQEGIIVNAISEVWHAAKQYYAQHPDELYKCVVL